MTIRLALDFASVRAGGGLRFATEFLPRIVRREDISLVAALLPPSLATNLDASSLRLVTSNSRYQSLSPAWRNALKESRPNVLFIPTESGLGLHGIRTVMMLRNLKNAVGSDSGLLTFPSRLKEIVRRRGARFFIVKADRLVAVSEYAKDIFQDSFKPGRLPPVDVVRHGVEPSLGGSEASDDSYSEGFKLLWISNLSRHKNIEALIDACKLIKEGPFGLTIVGAGFESRYGMGVRRELEALSSAFEVRFTGSVTPNQTLEEINRHDALVWTSTFESFALPTVEAAVLGRTVVAPEHRLFRELLGDVPLYYESRNPKSLARSILKAAETRGANRVVDLPFAYNWDQTVDGIVESFRRALIDQVQT